MGKIQVLMWIACVVISVNSSTKSQLRHRYFDVRTNYADLQNEMSNLKTELDYEFKRLANKTFIELDKNETERLRGNDYSPCFRVWMRMLREDIESLMIENYSVPCSELLRRTLNEINRRMTVGDTRIGVTIDRINGCINGSQNCTSSTEISALNTTVLRTKDRWSQFKMHVLVPTWRRMIRCFANFSSAVENKLSNLSEHASRCGSGTYEDLFLELGLQPLTVDKLIGSSIDRFKVDQLPFSPTVNGSEYHEKSEIMRTLKFLQTAMMQYVQRHLIFAMGNIFDQAVHYDVAVLLAFATNPDTVAEQNRSCYEEGIQHIQNRTRDYFEHYLENVCFYGLVDAKREFSNIVKCDLPVLEERMSKIRNCWADEGICQRIASRLEDFRSSLHTWAQFDLTSAMEGAKDCYSAATQLVFKIVNSSIDRLRKCESIQIPHIYQNVTKNVQPYPPYERAELCFVQPIDMDY